MDIKRSFEFAPQVELSASHIGLSKWKWKTIDSDSSTDFAMDFMNENHFDVIPITSKLSNVQEYYQTKSWGNYTQVERKQITEKDRIYYRTSFLDLLKKMKADGRLFFFLSNSDEVLGIVSLANLNSLPVYNYLYQIIADLETSISDYIASIASQNEILQILKSSSDKVANQIAKKFEELVAKGLDDNITEYLYLPTYSTLIKNLKNRIDVPESLLIQMRTKFDGKQLFGSIRNKIAHPVKPIFTSQESIAEVIEFVNESLELKNILDQFRLRKEREEKPYWVQHCAKIYLSDGGEGDFLGWLTNALEYLEDAIKFTESMKRWDEEDWIINLINGHSEISAEILDYLDNSFVETFTDYAEVVESVGYDHDGMAHSGYNAIYELCGLYMLIGSDYQEGPTTNFDDVSGYLNFEDERHDVYKRDDN